MENDYNTTDNVNTIQPQLIPDGIEFGDVRIFLSTNGQVQQNLALEPGGANWRITICDPGPAREARVEWRITPKNPEQWFWWMPWDGPHNPLPVGEAAPRKEYDYTPDGGSLDTWTWRDPFVPQPLSERHLTYGGHPSHGGGFAIPLLMLLPKVEGDATSLLFSPEDDLLEFRAQADADGVLFSDQYQRIGGGRTLSYRLHLFRHERDWRGALAGFAARYPAFIEPSVSNAALHGFAGYSASAVLPAPASGKLGRIVNWRASFDFPWMGNFMPDQEPWQSIGCLSDGRAVPGREQEMSSAVLNTYARDMFDLGHTVLGYFNVCEFGFGIRWPRPGEGESYCYGQARGANQQLWSRFPKAPLLGSHEPTMGPLFRSPAEHHSLQVRFHERPYWTWGDAIVMDPGDADWANHLVQQAEAIAIRIPNMAGIAIDRCDWLQEYNHAADDGGTWIAGRSARALVRSWKCLMPRISEALHPRGKAIVASLSTHRIDMARHLDGIFHEGGYYGPNLNFSTFLALAKPVLVWTHPMRVVEGERFRIRLFSGREIEEDVDEFFQRHLHMGSWPMAPVPGNDHSLAWDAEVEKRYFRYAPLFRLLVGRRWVLTPGAVAADHGRVNVFHVPDGLLVVATGQPDGKITFLLNPKLLVKSAEARAFTVDGECSVPVQSDATITAQTEHGMVAVLIRQNTHNQG